MKVGSNSRDKDLLNFIKLFESYQVYLKEADIGDRIWPGRPTQQFTKIRRPTGTDTGILVFGALKPFNLKI